jgi:hypothetical protein
VIRNLWDRSSPNYLKVNKAMPTLLERVSKVWDVIRQSPSFLPTCVPIPESHVDRAIGGPFTRNQHYFQVRLNEMYLPYSRQWATTYLPMTLALTEFQYNRAVQAAPMVVGPSLIEEKGISIPDSGLLLQDTRVAGLHPYTGGRVSVAIVLYRAQRENLVRKLLSIVESAASALDFSASSGVYLKIAATVLDGVEALFDGGQIQPLIGYRKEYDPDGNAPITPGYFALLANQQNNIDPARLWVKNNRLCYGDTLAEAVSVQERNAAAANPLQETEFVLYSLVQSVSRSDVDLLPFYPLWERVQREAAQPTEEHWRSAKANMLSLYQTISASPDLTEPQAKELVDEYVAKMQQLHQRAVELSGLTPAILIQGPPDAETLSLDMTRDQALAILDL